MDIRKKYLRKIIFLFSVFLLIFFSIAKTNEEKESTGNNVIKRDEETSYRLTIDDIKNPQSFIKKIIASEDTISKFVYDSFSNELKDLLEH